MNPHVNKICLGSAQFGLDYGIANVKGRTTDEEARAILQYAIAHGIGILDTAAAYGTSEEVIGRSLKSLGRSLKIVSKLPSFAETKPNPRETVMRSLKRLSVSKIYGYLLHSFEDFRKADLWQEMNALKEEGLVEKIGFSLYHQADARFLWDNNTAFDILQVPYSLFDRRFVKYLPLFKQRGVEIHVRSVFLQGLAFLEPAKLPPAVAGAREQLTALRKIAVREGISVSALCLNFALINPSVDRVIIGVDSVDHLKVNLSDVRFFAKTKAISGEDLNSSIINEEEILLPYRWKL
jgi:aryl-alcohol dehydrogenase-like predicted oxidoreductase